MGITYSSRGGKMGVAWGKHAPHGHAANMEWHEGAYGYDARTIGVTWGQPQGNMKEHVVTWA